MNKNFFSEHKSFIDGIADEIMNSDKDWIIDEIQGVYMEIINEIKNSEINLSISEDSKYLIIYAASIHIEENNKYLYIPFIFNFKEKQVLVISVYTDNADIDLNEINDNINHYMNLDKKRIQNFFAYANENNVSFDDLIQCADVIKESLCVYKNTKAKPHN